MDSPFPAGAAVPANTTGPGGTVVRYGAADASHELTVYADLRCPYCKRMENGLGTVMRHAADDGSLAIGYHFATFLDEVAGGSGSTRALSALGAACDEGRQPFAGYLRVLYAEQPPENDDAFADPGTLLRLSTEVSGLDTAGFRRKVDDATYVPWAGTVSAAFDSSGVRSTPTVALDGTPVAVLGPGGYAVTPEEFLAQLPV